MKTSAFRIVLRLLCCPDCLCLPFSVACVLICFFCSPASSVILWVKPHNKIWSWYFIHDKLLLGYINILSLVESTSLSPRYRTRAQLSSVRAKIVFRPRVLQLNAAYFNFCSVCFYLYSILLVVRMSASFPTNCSTGSRMRFSWLPMESKSCRELIVCTHAHYSSSLFLFFLCNIKKQNPVPLSEVQRTNSRTPWCSFFMAHSWQKENTRVQVLFELLLL